MDPNCSSLNFSTFIGGNENEYPENIEIDSKGNIYVTGVTHSPDFPNTTEAFDTTYNGYDDVFVLTVDMKFFSLKSS